MGTRSLTIVFEDGTELVNMYRQFDGYISGHGHDLAKFLNNGRMVNGIGMNDGPNVFNGMGCLAAQMVAYFKDGPGGFYLMPSNERDAGAEYRYEVSYGDELRVVVFSGYGEQWEEIFNGTPGELAAWEEIESE
jgi:hypothetical protein